MKTISKALLFGVTVTVFNSCQKQSDNERTSRPSSPELVSRKVEDQTTVKVNSGAGLVENQQTVSVRLEYIDTAANTAAIGQCLPALEPTLEIGEARCSSDDTVSVITAGMVHQTCDGAVRTTSSLDFPEAVQKCPDAVEFGTFQFNPPLLMEVRDVDGTIEIEP